MSECPTYGGGECPPPSTTTTVPPSTTTTSTTVPDEPPGLPVTGGDVLGLAGIGLAMTVAGAAMVRRRR
jgi:hypothetical protein